MIRPQQLPSSPVELMEQLHHPIVTPIQMYPLCDAEAGDHTILVGSAAYIKPVAALETHSAESFQLPVQLHYTTLQTLVMLLRMLLPLPELMLLVVHWLRHRLLLLTCC